MTVYRQDRATVRGKIRKTSQGFLRIPASLTRTGVLEYKDKHGNIRRELRPPEEVFRQDSLASLEDAPVTYLHPDEMVTPVNVRALQRGHVTTAKQSDANTHVVGEVIVTDPEMIKAIENKSVKELSPGYAIELDETPGVTPSGERYDAVQRNIEYNHIGLGPPGWGRSGPSVALRLDSVDDAATEVLRLDDDLELDKKGTPMTVKIRIDEKTFEVSESSASDLEKLISQKTEALASLQTELKTANEKLTELNGALEARKDFVSPGDLEKEVKIALQKQTKSERLRKDAQELFLGEDDLSEKTDREVLEAALAKSSLSEVDVSEWTDERVEARFDAICEVERSNQTSADESLRKSVRAGANVKKSSERVDSASAREKMIERMTKAHLQEN